MSFSEECPTTCMIDGMHHRSVKWYKLIIDTNMYRVARSHFNEIGTQKGKCATQATIKIQFLLEITNVLNMRLTGGARADMN